MKLPRARRDKLVVEELSDETLIYDLERDKAHCLNSTAARVWRHCDGHTTVRQLTANLRREIHPQANEQLVLLALTKLRKAHLLHDLPEKAIGEPQSRREWARHVGVIGGLSLLIPAVVSIVAPTALAAGSCTTVSACAANPRNNVGKCCCDGTPRRPCKTNGSCGGIAC